MVGWLTVQHSVKSQAHTDPGDDASCRRMEMRTGSAIACRSCTSGFVFFTPPLYRRMSIYILVYAWVSKV